jgi:hypothetical protein
VKRAYLRLIFRIDETLFLPVELALDCSGLVILRRIRSSCSLDDQTTQRAVRLPAYVRKESEAVAPFEDRFVFTWPNVEVGSRQIYGLAYIAEIELRPSLFWS